MAERTDERLTGRGLTRRQVVSLFGAAALATVCSPASTSGSPATGSGAAASGAPKRGGKLTYGKTSDLAGFDPGPLILRNFPMYHCVYDSLIRLDDSHQPQPWLAESWEFDSTGRQLKLNLRKGVHFHSGREFGAADVAANLAHYQDATNAAQFRGAANLVTSVNVQDQYTAILNFANPFPAVFDMLDFFLIFDKDSEKDLKQRGIGTGPYKFDSWTPGVEAHFVRNANYWRSGEPYFDEIVVSVLPDQQAMTAALEAGQIDIAETPTVQDAVRLDKNPKFKVVKIRSGLVANPTCNVTNPKFANKLVRQAINHSIDRQRFVDIATLGLSEPLGQASPRGSWANFPELDGRWAFDLNLAKQLLVQAGAGDGFDTEIVVSTGGFPEGVILAEVMQPDLAKIGIRMKITNLEAAAWSTMSNNQGETDMFMNVRGQAKKDPASIFGATVAFRPGNNLAKFRSDEYESLIAKGAATIDQSQRIPIYKRLNEILLDECFSMSAAQRIDLFLLKATVQNLSFSIDSLPHLGQAWFAS